MIRALMLGAALLSLSACSHLAGSRSEVKAHIHAWESLGHELSELLVAETITRKRLTDDARDWNLLALEFSDLQHRNSTASVDGARAYQGFSAYYSQMTGVPMLSGVTPKKARVLRDLANLQGHLSTALMGMSQANKSFLQLEGSDDAFDMLDEAYNVGIWSINKYTRYMRQLIRFKKPTTPISDRRASEVLRELNGI